MAKRASKKNAFPLLDHVDKQMTKVHENVAAALEKFDEDAIHDARVATRRMKAALELLAPVLSKRHRKPLDNGLKKIRRRLGPLRDVDVMIHHLSDLVKDRRHGKAAAWLQARLEESRQSLHEESEEGPSVEKSLRRLESWPMVRSEILEAREGVDSMLAESLHEQTDAFAAQADRLVAEYATRHAIGDEGAGDAIKPARRQNPHDLRIAGKALRYTLEMAEAEGRSPGARVMTSFKRMQELLGTWHDYVVLADSALKEVIAAELMHHEVTTSDRVIDLAKFAVKRSAQELSAFCKLWEQKGEPIATRIRSLFELTKAVAGPEERESKTLTQEKPSDAVADSSTSGADQENSDEADNLTESQTDRDPSETAPSEGREEASTTSPQAV